MYYWFYLLLIVVNHCKMFWKPIYLDKFLLMFFFKIYQNLIERYFKRYLTSECSSLFIAYCLLVWSSIVSKFKMQFSIAMHRYSSPSFIHLHTGKNKKNTAMITMINALCCFSFQIWQRTLIWRVLTVWTKLKCCWTTESLPDLK